MKNNFLCTNLSIIFDKFSKYFSKVSDTKNPNKKRRHLERRTRRRVNANTSP